MKLMILQVFALMVCAAGSGVADAGNGRDVFAAKCASCHGKDGKGNPAMAKMFKVEPAAMDLTGAGAQSKTDDELVGLLSKGRNKMPAFAGKLKDGEIADAVAYIRSLGSPAPGKKEAKPAGREGPAAGESSAAATLFGAKCASCHAKDGAGSPAMVKMFKVAPEALNLVDGETLGRTDEDLAKIIESGKGKMPAFSREKLKDVSVKDLIAFLRSLAPAKKEAKP